MSSENVGLNAAQNIDSSNKSTRNTHSRKHSNSKGDPAYSNDPPGLPISASSRELLNTNQMPAYSTNHGHSEGTFGKLGQTMTTSQLHSIQLVDDLENILFEDYNALATALNCPVDRPVKVISIVGNTGDGKSHTLNHTFCGSSQVFTTSPSQKTCTMGIWAVYLPEPSCILLDTEGFLGTSLNQNQHRRLLLKVFALSDVVIYLTKAARLHSDMFAVLADASDAFATHFQPDLVALAKRTKLPWTPCQLGPAVIVFQETRHTNPIDQSDPLDASMLSGVSVSRSQDGRTLSSGSKFIRQRLGEMKRNADSFSSLHYLGLQTKGDVTNFQPLASLVTELVGDNAIRASRGLQHIFACLQSLNARFTSDLPTVAEGKTFVDEYFTCHVTCLSCAARCCLGVGHLGDGLSHHAPPPSAPDKLVRSGSGKKTGKPVGDRNNVETPCRYDQSLQNKLYFCKDCYTNGHRTMMLPKIGESVIHAARYLYSGYVLECPKHGVVYRSRQHWSGNPEPEETPSVHWEVIHLWDGEKSILQGLHPFSQVLVDGLSSVTSQVSQLTGPPTRLLTDLLVDSMAPDYWQPNSTITTCAICNFAFPDTVVDGVDYSTYAAAAAMGTVSGTAAAPSFGLLPVQRTAVEGEEGTLSIGVPPAPAYLGAGLAQNSVMLPAQAEDLPGSRPLRQVAGGTGKTALPEDLRVLQDVTKHHCRVCGLGVCAVCSTARIPVPGYGPHPVRVCDRCYRNEVNNRKLYQSGSTQSSAPSRGDRRASGGSGAGGGGQNRKAAAATTAGVEHDTLSDGGSDTAVYTGRKALEMCMATVGAVPPLLSHLKNTIKGFARPDYWIPDDQCRQCAVCDLAFGPSRRIHHCRACGRGVCEPCSPHRQPVPIRGLDQLHRICNECINSDLLKQRR